MVRVFSMSYFEKQMVDSVDDACAITMTQDNKLLIAKSNYTIEVRDTLSEIKGPLFSFPCIDKVEVVQHSMCGNYVVTLEHKQTNKTSVLIIRIYTNWSADFVVNESRKSTKFVRHFIRARIAGYVTPSSDENYLDMIEIPETFSKESIITCCQRTGKLGVVNGSMFRLYSQVYLRNHGTRFMDFIPFIQVYQLSFPPTSVRIDGYIVSVCNDHMVVVFDLVKKFKGKNVDKAYLVNDANDETSSDEEEQLLNEKCKELVVSDRGIHIDNLIKIIREDQEKCLKGILVNESVPVAVHLPHINDKVLPSNLKKFPFKILKNVLNPNIMYSKVEDTCVETLYCANDYLIVARTLLALSFDQQDDTIWKMSTQLVMKRNKENVKTKTSNPAELFTVNNVLCLHFMVTTYQEGFLFCLNPFKPQIKPQCRSVFNFTSPIIGIAFKSCFLHVITDVGLEIYNIPTYRSLILKEKMNQSECTRYISIFSMQPFINIIDFFISFDCITLFTSVNELTDKKNFPWTVYCLKLRRNCDIYKEIMDTAMMYKTNDEKTYRYLATEALVLIIAEFHNKVTNEVKNHMNDLSLYTKYSVELAESYYRSKRVNDTRMGTKIILESNLHPMDFIKSCKSTSDVSESIVKLLKVWLKGKHGETLTEQQAEQVIEMYEQNEAVEDLAKFLLMDEKLCRQCGHKAIQFLKKNVQYSFNEDTVNIRAMYALCVLYTQQCMLTEATELLNKVHENNELQPAFVKFISEYWIFLFERNMNNGKELIDFSDWTSLLIESLPVQLSNVLAELILQGNKFNIFDIVQMLLKQFPCRVSMQKGHAVLQKFLELIFSHKQVMEMRDANVNNCLKILVRSYLTQLPLNCTNRINSSEHIHIFTTLPSFVDYLPTVSNCDYTVLRKLQELIWSNLISEESVHDICVTLPSVEFKLNILAMLRNFDFVKELLKHQFTGVIFPYAKITFDENKKWQDLVILLQNNITELKSSTVGHEKSLERCRETLREVLNYMSKTIAPLQWNDILESLISKTDDTYQEYLMKAQKISYANDVKELIANSSQQILSCKFKQRNAKGQPAFNI